MTKLALVLSTLLTSAVAETIHGVVVFSRHGDRTTKHYKNQQLTSLGAEQNFLQGSQFRSRYLDADSSLQILGVSEDKYVSAQVAASAPDQAILLNTATAFLQGLYPPLEGLDPDLAANQLNNGSDSVSPLNGYQYVVLHGQSADAPDAIWIKGDDSCPSAITAQNSFMKSDEFAQRSEETKSFYEKFQDTLKDVYDYSTPANFSYKNAYDIFDLVNVARIHNASSPSLDVSDEDLFQLRTLADSAEFGTNFNASQPDRDIHARTLNAGLLAQLQQIVTTKAKLKFSLFAGSYDTMLAFFGVNGLTELSDDFKGLPDYASTLSFELFTENDVTGFPDSTDDLRVRFFLKNGTTGAFTSYPLFGTGEDSLSWSDFESSMTERSLSEVGEWCTTCNSELPFCAAYVDSKASGSNDGKDSDDKGGMSGLTKAGIAMLVIGCVFLVAGLALFLMSRKKRAQGPVAVAGAPITSDQKSINSASTPSQV
ncbi:unnamed protein product [Parascedosporium putredinis]|uniref:Histidine acid phosphatase n=1 Tax=Parascedosporium putredinis TaxID=1442378 RepID=A0A9P1M759_9PEZI|nr:unnamed protein product [Parascedosporium putredinis]CAI7987851.1 unnamed protein product [Parascedosporium putredinis]